MSETTVYQIGWDVDRYQAFLYDLPSPELEMWLFDGLPRRDSWSPQPVYSDQPLLERPDIWHLVGSTIMIMSKEVVELLEPFLSRAGELLPFVVSGSNEEVLGLNILKVVDCIDPRAYSLDDLQLYPAFLEHRLPESGLFKIPQLATGHVFYVERNDDEDSLRSRIARYGLRGANFDLVFSSSAGPVPINLFG
jgi:hypothetical protein